MPSNAESMYQLRFLPSALQDLTEIARYISHELTNPEAAEKLSDEIIDAAEKLAAFPYAYAVYTPSRPLKHEYRRVPVKNYLIFYWIQEEEKEVVIARIIYGKRLYENKL